MTLALAPDARLSNALDIIEFVARDEVKRGATYRAKELRDAAALLRELAGCEVSAPVPPRFNPLADCSHLQGVDYAAEPDMIADVLRWSAQNGFYRGKNFSVRGYGTVNVGALMWRAAEAIERLLEQSAPQPNGLS